MHVLGLGMCHVHLCEGRELLGDGVQPLILHSGHSGIGIFLGQYRCLLLWTIYCAFGYFSV